MDVSRAVRCDAERPPLTTQRVEALLHTRQAPRRASNAIQVLPPEVTRVVPKPKFFPQTDEIRWVGPLAEPLADGGLSAFG